MKSFPPFTTSAERAPASSSSDVVARARAVVPDHEHRHFRDDGKGYVVHRHAVHSERHGHPTLGLAFTLLGWRGWNWRRAGGALVYVGTVAVFVGFAAMWLIGAWAFSKDVRWP